ncbi:hypothetical protein C3Y87_07420 [Carbonactinospora thermoautotrophica]|uniref:antitoxin n=1 Tax=Carbonactinospora thermoautotrophica TaxID=1469144 RepID=UPI00226DD78B|nr:antitoxin [Carbonactinospora thermoautotrophica]MCX9191243.1 hypothetical protein [Carbonactinospora thermoautotrophica]
MGIFGIFDKFKQHAREHGEQVKQGLDKAARFADEKTGGRHSEQIQSAREQADKYLTGQGGEPASGRQETSSGHGEPGGEPGKESYTAPSDTEEGTTETGEPGEWRTREPGAPPPDLR